MLKKSIEELSALGADITASEIKQQPEMWLKTLTIFRDREEEINKFLQKVKQATDKKVRIIFAGAGSSQYIGDTLVPYLNRTGDICRFRFESIGTTDIVAVPEDYLLKDETTILISFGRSGNSPESMAAVELADKRIDNVYHIVITCAQDGLLAKEMEGREDSLLLLTPKKANDKGFAMTSSFTCMLVLALMIFDGTDIGQKAEYLETAASIGQEVIEREEEIESFLNKDYERIVYLGSGSLAGLAREAQLKVLELTAGKLSTVFDSSMGFRHGPKSFINEKTLLFMFVSSDPRTRKYDLDVLEEVRADKVAAGVLAIAQNIQQAQEPGGTGFVYGERMALPEAYLALPDIMAAQIVSLLCSVKMGNTPDTPSPTGTVNRVVKGVTIYANL